MAQSPEDGTLLAELRELRERVARLERADRLGMTSFREPGRWRFLDQNGNERFLIGRAGEEGQINLRYRRPDGSVPWVVGTIFVGDPVHSIAHGLLVQKPNAEDLIRAWSGEDNQLALLYWGVEQAAVRITTDGGDDVLRLQRPDGSVVHQVDDSGKRWPVTPVSFLDGWGHVDTIDSGDWTEIAEARCRKDAEHLWVQARVLLTGSGTFELRIRDATGTPVTIGTSSPVSSSSYTSFDATLVGDNQTWRALAVEGRRTAGSGSARVAMVYGEIGN